jgi:hypothetical protein
MEVCQAAQQKAYDYAKRCGSVKLAQRNGFGRIEVANAQMLAAQDQQISLTDPDSRSMATMHKARILLHD